MLIDKKIIFYFYCMSTAKQTKGQPSQPIEKREPFQFFAFQFLDLPQIYWDTACIDSKFYIAHPLTLDKLLKLEAQIAVQKIKMSEPQNSKQLNKSKDKSLLSNNSQLSESGRSRDCKTQRNAFQEFKQKLKIQSQLDIEERKYKHKLDQLKIKKANGHPQFIIKDIKYIKKNSSNKSQIHNQQEPRKSSIQNENIEIVQRETSIKVEKQKQSRQDDSIPKLNSKLFRNKQKSNQEQARQEQIKSQVQINSRNLQKQRSTNKNQGLTPVQKQIQNIQSINSKNAIKSFVVSQKKKYSKSRRNSYSNQKQEPKNKHSKQQIQQLTHKIQEMQSKLNDMEKKQNYLQQIEMSRVTVSKPQLPKLNSLEATLNQHFNQKNEFRKNEALISSKVSQKISTNQPFLDSKMYKHKLGFASSTVEFCNNKLIINKKSDQKEKSRKQQMMQQINKLKKTIRQLQVQRVKHEKQINELKTKQQQRAQNLQKVAKSSHGKIANIKTNEAIIKYQASNNNNDDPFQITQTASIKKSEAKYIYNRHDYSQSPVPKRQKSHPIKMDKKSSIIPSQTQMDFKTSREKSRKRNQFVRSPSNPQDRDTSIRKFYPSSLRHKGIIARQVRRQQRPYTKQWSRSNKLQYIQKSGDIQPPSPTSTGKKVFELQFVKQTQRHKSQIEQPPNILIPNFKVKGFQIPKIPAAPTPQANQYQLLNLAKQVCSIFNIKTELEDHIYLKKYKNCVIFKTHDTKKTVVWHYSGKLYIGGWEQNQNGQGKKIGDGFEYNPNKYYYQGQFLQGKRNGSGKMMMIATNDIYQGQWINGQKHGHGIYLQSSSGIIYEGQWKCDKKNGKGIIKFSQKQYYEGLFVNSVKHGYGCELFDIGDFYQGEYKQDRFHGNGKYIWKNGATYQGNFINGKRNGRGRWKSNLVGYDTYIGEYKDDKKSGKGQYIWNNGCVYDGQFKNDLKDGNGRVIYPDGRQIKGFWENGKLKQIDSKMEESQISSHRDYPLERPIGKIIQTPSRQLQCSKLVSKV